MHRFVQVLVFTLFFAVSTSAAFSADGDTIIVKTLTFDDITKRSGTWLFPPPGRYEKVLMQYTLKCDSRTTQDQYPCGEWDYLTYNILRDSTGEFDSTRRTQVNFRVRGGTPDSFAYRSTFVDATRRFRTTSATRTTEGDFVSIGTGSQANSALVRPGGGRMRFIWKASELSAAGISAGSLCGIRMQSTAAVAEAKVFTVRMQNVANATLAKVFRNDEGTAVIRRNVALVEGENNLPFSTPFAWDGTSDIVVEFSCLDASSTATIKADGAAGLADAGGRKAYRFTAGDRIDVPGEIGQSITNEVTISYWCYGDALKMPRAHNTVEAYDAQGRRVINIHAPWDNGTVYWDCGYNPTDGAYDRIEKNTIPENWEGRWNHWTFVKTRTGVMRIYLNGSLFHEGNGKTRAMNGITKFVIGSGGSGSYEGLLDEIQVWNVALDEATIKSYLNRQIDDAHPKYANLILYYHGELDTDPLVARDASPSGFNGAKFGIPTTETLLMDYLGYMTQVSTSRPTLAFELGSLPATSARVDVDVVTEPRRTSVVLFERPVLPRIYREDAADHPSVATDTILVQEAGKLYTLDEAGLIVDSTIVAAETTLRKQELPYFSPIVDFEIGRYITPYGIGLDLGPKGFRWEYDVTDFAPLLRNNVTLSAGNQQELIDVTFVFIKGTPSRDVKQIDQVYYERGAQFTAVLENKSSLAPVDVALNKNASTFRLKAVTSGHEFSNETNCAEFCPRNHFINVNGQERFNWRLWTECGDNPVFPQGGTWLIDRTGWCPGAPVDLYEFELTPHVQGASTVNLDYGVKKEAANELWGRWEVSMQLIGYGEPNFKKDAAIVDVISPNSWEYYGRLNPICGEPVVVIANNGSTPMTACVIEYEIDGGGKSTYNWTGNLGFLQRDTVVLPAPAWPTSSGMSSFVVRTVLPDDEYANNNSRTTSFVMPPVYYSDLQINLRTNKQASIQYTWRLKKTTGEIIGQGSNLESEKTYTYDFNLANGCYDFELVNKEGLGLDFWFYRAQLGSGSLSFRSGGSTIKTFEPDFGNKAWMQFTVASKPTIATNTDSVRWELPAPGRAERTFVIRAANDVPLRVDSLSIFSVRKHFFVVSTSQQLPTTLQPGDSIVVTLAFERPDVGTSSGSIRVHTNDERNSAKQVRLVGVVGTTNVNDDVIDPSMVVIGDVVPHPVRDNAALRVQVYREDLLTGAQIIVRDLVGRLVATVHTGNLTAGEHSFEIPASLPVGSYVISIESSMVRQTIPLVVAQ